MTSLTFLFVRRLAVALLFLSLCGPASAALYYSWSGSQAIPDNNPSGVAYSIGLSAPGTPEVTSVSVSFSISGGFNGDLYAYLSYGSGIAVLLNHVGASGGNPYGYADHGFNVTLTDGAVNGDIHNYQVTLSGPPSGGVLTGTWAPDGRVNYADTSRPDTLSVFNGMNPNGNWTLFFADLSAGDVATLTSFSLDVTAVPEPANLALAAFAVILVSLAAFQYRRRA